jgi:excinuclease UvrABC nuclease subunit
VYRDQLAAIDKVREEQRVVSVDDIDRDVLGLHREGDLVELALLHIRRGKLADVATFSVKNAEVPDEEVVAAFLAQHFEEVHPWFVRGFGGAAVQRELDGRHRITSSTVAPEFLLPVRDSARRDP